MKSSRSTPCEQFRTGDHRVVDPVVKGSDPLGSSQMINGRYRYRAGDQPRSHSSLLGATASGTAPKVALRAGPGSVYLSR